MPICKECGEPFEKWSRGGNWKYCPDCGYTNAKKKGFLNRYQGPSLSRQKVRADNIGNLKVWRPGDPIDGLPPDLQKRIKTAINFKV